jgi:hypothetical protein
VQKNKPPKTKTHGVFKHHKSKKHKSNNKKSAKQKVFLLLRCGWIWLFWWL